MTEIWLQSNRRVYLPALVLTATMTLTNTIGALVVDGSLAPAAKSVWVIAAVGFAIAFLGVLRFATRPRLAFDGRQLRVNIGKVNPAVIPIELVEGFFLGKGPAYLKGKDDYKTETSTLIVRVAERAPEWEKLPTDVRVAAWCGHHITLRGTWTEPLNVDVANRLNQRLYDVQQAAKSKVEVAS